MFKLSWVANGLKPLKNIGKYQPLKIASASFALLAAACVQIPATSDRTVPAERRSCYANAGLLSQLT